MSYLCTSAAANRVNNPGLDEIFVSNRLVVGI